DLVHTTDGLEHGGLPVDFIVVELAFGQVGGKKLVKFQRWMQNVLCLSGAPRLHKAGAHGTNIFPIGIQVAEGLQKVQQESGVFFGECVVQGVRVQALGEQLRQ